MAHECFGTGMKASEGGRKSPFRIRNDPGVSWANKSQSDVCEEYTQKGDFDTTKRQEAYVVYYILVPSKFSRHPY
eukprot:SAG31_NODE_15769_length_739_cov_2.035938_1_plen_75_part_00